MGSGGTDSGSKARGEGGTSKSGKDGSCEGGGPNMRDLSVIGPVYAGSSMGTGIGVGRSVDGSWNHMC